VLVHSSIPELPGHWLWGHLDARRNDPLNLFTRLSRLGEVSAGRILWMRGLLLNHPDAVKHVLVEEYGPAVLELPSAKGFGLAAYIVPPIENIADGPSGVSVYPGTGATKVIVMNPGDKVEF